ncbi:MAG TPA: hypothetical protein VM427_04200 [Patescibacteria group bacterium]|nr:hypothetical protein [Patescibacteria group bacterium]
MDRSVARIGSIAGWLSLAGIFGYHLMLTVLAGQRVSGTSDLGAIQAYFGQSAVAAAGVEQFIVVIAVAVFVVALRQTLAVDDLRGMITTVALVAAGAELAVILVEISIQAALVVSVQAGEPVAGLFRLWDVLYNSGAYALEATWVIAFGIAMRNRPEFPAPMRWLSAIGGALLAINIFAIWIHIPDAATLPSAVVLAVWLAGASIGLGRIGSPDAVARTSVTSSQPA